MKEPKKPSDRITKVSIKRMVWKRDNHECTNCGSSHAVQEDHRIPEAVGGCYSEENIRLLCRSCNQRSAIEFFGVEKMEKHLTRGAAGEQLETLVHKGRAVKPGIQSAMSISAF